MTVSLRQPVEAGEEETLPPPTPIPEAALGVVIARPEEAPPSPELIAMPTEEPANEEHVGPLPATSAAVFPAVARFPAVA